MLKRLAAMLAALMLLSGTACAQIVWPQEMTMGQLLLSEYVERVNRNLTALGAPQVDALFECYPGFASLGAGAEGAEVPEDVELVVTMSDAGLQKLVLRVCRPELFTDLAVACIQAASPDQMTIEDAKKACSAYAQRVMKEPDNSFGDEVQEQQGDTIRMYYGYEPNAFDDGVNWMRMTLIFAWSGIANGGMYVTATPAPQTDYGNEYEGTRFDDGYVHLEVFLTPSPAPEDGLVG